MEEENPPLKKADEMKCFVPAHQDVVSRVRLIVPCDFVHDVSLSTRYDCRRRFFTLAYAIMS